MQGPGSSVLGTNDQRPRAADPPLYPYLHTPASPLMGYWKADETLKIGAICADSITVRMQGQNYADAQAELALDRVVPKETSSMGTLDTSSYEDTDRENRRAERASRELEDRLFRLLVESFDAPISVIRSDGILFFLNEAAAMEMGGKPEDLTGKSLWDVLPKSEADKYMESVHRVIDSGVGYTTEHLVRLPSGDKWFSANIQPIIEPNTKRPSVQIISRDITEHKRAEEVLRKSIEREAQAYAQGRLEVVDTILHNLGNAINSVTIGIGTIHENLANGRLTRHLLSLANAMAEHHDHLGEYVKNNPQGQKVGPFIIALADDFAKRDQELIGTVSRVRERAEHIADIIRTEKTLSKRSAYRKNVNLSKAIDNAITVLNDPIGKQGVEISVDCSGAPREISTQESQFHQMLVNLIKNSIEASHDLEKPEGSRDTLTVTIKCYAKSESLILEVTDEGVGIEKEKLDLVFRSGYTTKESGSGLGLHSIANFVKGCGGQIQALSDGVGKGTTMRVVLPASSAAS